jgi:hypothetical protein
MPLPTSSLSQVCRSIANFVSNGLNDSDNFIIRVMIGNPADAVPGGTGGEHHLNLFFYLVEPAGFFPDTGPGDTWWLRLQCLVTGFGIAEDNVSAGENDLRLLGEVMRLFHETPVVDVDVEDETFRLQVIFQALNPDDLNHIWSTQGDVSYRPSAAYEMSLAPVIPAQRTTGSPLVGAAGSQIRADISARRAPFEGEALAPPVPLTVVDVSLEDWAPAIALIHQGQCAWSLAFDRDGDALKDFTPAVWVAGKVEEPAVMVTLAWEKWTSTQGWKREDVTDVAVTDPAIDPARAGEAVTTAIDLPFGENETGQAVLYAERTYLRASDDRPVTVRSNPVLVTVYAEEDAV